MRKANYTDREALHGLYNEALTHANKTGHIDWPNPFMIEHVDEMLPYLYCIDESGVIDGAVKVSLVPNQNIWGSDSTRAIYLGRAATGNRTRGTNFVGDIMLPEAARYFYGVPIARFDCLADNGKLIELYKGLGSRELDEVTFYSNRQQTDITVARFELSI